MPWASARPCRRSPSGCPNKTTARDGYCEKCRALVQKKQDASPWRQQAHAFYRSRAWQYCRLLVLARDPVCKICGRELSKVADHHPRPLRYYLARGDIAGAAEPEHSRGICWGCSNRISGQEARAHQLGRKSA